MKNETDVLQGMLYPVLLKLEREGPVASDWGVSENNRRARTAAIMTRFFAARAGDLE
jgi:DNA-binding PadR family transcriptional regulator